MQLINGLHFRNLRGDFYGGLTAAVVALPLALAMGVASGAGPVAGLYGSIFVGLFAALFGGTPSQISGPTGPMTVVMAAIFIQFTSLYPDDPSRGAALAFTVVILGGAFQILFGLLKLGKYINLIPHPVVSGFMSGIGVIIILLQVGPLLGHAGVSDPMKAVQAIPNFVFSSVWSATVLGLFTLLLVYFLPARINRLIPSPLFALVAGTATLYLLSGGEVLMSTPVAGVVSYTMSGAAVLGTIPNATPSITLPSIEFELLADMLKSALMLATLGTIDSLLTSLVADNITRTQHRSNRELIGQGIGNMVSGLFGGLPGAGATMRTVVNVRVGGSTPISGVLHALILLLVVLGAGSIVQYIPHAVLAGILIKVGTDIIDWDYLLKLRSNSVPGIAVMASVFFITVFIDLITAVAVGMVMASLILVQRMSDLQIDSITAITDPQEKLPLNTEEHAILESADGRILLYHLNGPMSFCAAKGMLGPMAKFDEYRVLVVDLTDVPHIDDSAVRALEDIIDDANYHDRDVFLICAQAQVCVRLRVRGIPSKLTTGTVQPDRLIALRLARDLL